MKKWFLVLFIILSVSSYYFYRSHENGVTPEPLLNQSSENPASSSSSEVVDVAVNIKLTETEKELTPRQCKQFYGNFSAHIRDSHRILIDALAIELRGGATSDDLMQYSYMYTTSYKSYEDLIHLAKVKIAKESIEYTNKVGHVAEWKGFDSYLGMNKTELTVLANSLEPVGDTTSIYMPINTKDIKGVSREALISLHENDKSFNTYVASPLRFDDRSVVSPSILSVTHAQLFTTEEYQGLIAEHRFTAHELAVAINGQLPIEYIKLIIEQSDNIGGYPAFEQSDFAHYENIADIAVAQFNTEVLKLLAARGVTPNDSANTSGLNLAFSRLPDDPNSQITPKQSEMIEYLHQSGQKLKGHYSDDGKAFYSSGVNRFYIDFTDLDKTLTSKLNFQEVDSIEDEMNVPIELSKAFAEYGELKQVISQQSEQCADITRKEKNKEGFEPAKKMHDLISEIKNNSKHIAEELHQIDPLLYQKWNHQNRVRENGKKIELINLLRNKQYSEASDYVSANSLSQDETNYLFLHALQETDVYIDIWNARTDSTPPNNFYYFNSVTIEQAKGLYDRGFDFNLKDHEGSSLLAVSLKSEEVFKMLIGLEVTEDFTRLGRDLFDRVLDKSYKEGKLFSYINEVAQMVEVIEPSHFARIERLKRFYPEEYQTLIEIDKRLIPAEGTEMNKYR
ncbi:hypothetical protein AN944_02468 [Shewanella sp. P1-14-1]|uniref:hypothetical protein n=1 Tax=Shewanella sp. P1-14-1 TaxID=1723761 RepID=UPI0006D67FC8|nr:hypothetical protein [Shewanella sp. P1-14-1]KPZ70084.1 hypothetical protein AN944_02468 [Shewanella sp. P1-14-1]